MSLVPLTQAITSGDASEVAALLANGADVNERTSGGQTPLILATIFGHAHLIPLLLNAGADPQLRDNLGLNAVDWAQRRGATEVIEVLTNSPRRGTYTRTEAPRVSAPARGAAPLEREVEKPKAISAAEKSQRWLAGLKQRIAEQQERIAEQQERTPEPQTPPPLEPPSPLPSSGPLASLPESGIENAGPRTTPIEAAVDDSASIVTPELEPQTEPQFVSSPPVQTQPQSVSSPRLQTEPQSRSSSELETEPQPLLPSAETLAPVPASAIENAKTRTTPIEAAPNRTAFTRTAEEEALPRTSQQETVALPRTSEQEEVAQPRTGRRKRCPRCNAIYHSDLVAYCAHHVVPLIDEDEAPIISEPPKNSNVLFWLIIIITLTGSVAIGSIFTALFYTTNKRPAQVATSPSGAVQKGAPTVGPELDGKVVSLPVAECPLNGQEAIPGKVQVRVVIDKSGQVTSARASGGDWLLRGAASEAAMKSTFSAGFAIGWPALQANALENSCMFTTTPLMRYLSGECGSVKARRRMSSGRSLAQAHCAKPTKKRCSGVSPSAGFRSLFFVATCHAIYARISPPRSATSSPSVSRLLMWMSSTTTYCAY